MEIVKAQRRTEADDVHPQATPDDFRQSRVDGVRRPRGPKCLARLANQIDVEVDRRVLSHESTICRYGTFVNAFWTA